MVIKVLDSIVVEEVHPLAYQAGFEVVGVGHHKRHRLSSSLFSTMCYNYSKIKPLNGFQQFDIIHVLPPCQGFSGTTPSDSSKNRKVCKINHIPEVRAFLEKIGVDYVIENVEWFAVAPRRIIVWLGIWAKG